MSEPSDRLVNVFGALSQVVSDRVRVAIAGDFHARGETAAALIAIGHDPGMSIGHLRQVLRLSHAGAVRVVERLEDQDLVVKSQSSLDGRVVLVTLTVRGQERRTKLLRLRNAAVAELLAKVPAEDRVALERAAGSILSSLADEHLGDLATCRLCDQARCSDCPVNSRHP